LPRAKNLKLCALPFAPLVLMLIRATYNHAAAGMMSGTCKPTFLKLLNFINGIWLSRFLRVLIFVRLAQDTLQQSGQTAGNNKALIFS
jgi:hypothetical protein